MGVPPAPAVFPRQLQSGDGGRLLRAFSLVTSSPDGTGAIWKAKTLSLEERRRQPPPHFRRWEMLPTHSTPPLDSCPQSGPGLGGAHGKVSLGNVVVWIILSGLDPTPPHPPQRKFCLFRKGPYSSQKFLTLAIRYPQTPLTGFQRKCGLRSGQERRRRGSRSRILRT